MHRSDENFYLVLGAKQQLGDLRPQTQELANNWGDSEIVDLKTKFRANCEGKILDFAFSLHCVKDGGVDVIADVEYFKMGPVTANKNFTIVQYRSLSECLNSISDIEKEAQFWGDSLYNIFYDF